MTVSYTTRGTRIYRFAPSVKSQDGRGKKTFMMHANQMMIHQNNREFLSRFSAIFLSYQGCKVVYTEEVAKEIRWHSESESMMENYDTPRH